jgi:hypothetical protein
MLELLLSPIPFVVIFVLIIMADFIKHKNLKRVLKYALLAFVIAAIIMVWINSLNHKLIDSNLNSQAQLLLSITLHTEKLLQDNKIEDAKKIVTEFNLHYEKTFFSNDKLIEFLKEKNIPIYNSIVHIAEETERRMKMNQQKEDSEQQFAPDR